MPSILTGAEITEKFDRQYRLGEAAILRDVERAACGCDFGGTSWTTKSEADDLGRLLQLAPDVELLEIGAGTGWPSLHQTKTSGCNATLTELSREGLRVAEKRAKTDGLSDQCRFVLAPCFDLPFDDGAFDAIGHSDVLCCVAEKLETLKECRRLIRAGGRMAFSVIYVGESASRADIERAIAAGPSLVEAPASYPTMLDATGWEIEHQVDITAEFAGAVARLAGEYETHADRLSELIGAEEYNGTLAKLLIKREAASKGILKRGIFCVTPVV